MKSSAATRSGVTSISTKPVEYEQFAEAMRKLGLFLSIVQLPLGE